MALWMLSMLVGACGIYNFSGTSISPDVKTISIPLFPNDAGNGPPSLSISFTEKLRDYFQSNSSLKIVKAEGDLHLEGEITGYSVAPLAPAGGATELATQNRLTIQVMARFTNSKDSTQNFKSPFSFYFDYPQTRSLSQVENEAVEEILNQIVFDMFNKSLANW